MDQAAVAAVNSAVERVRRQIEELERRTETQDTLASEMARKQAAWARTQIALDEEHADLFVHANDALEEDVARKHLQQSQLVERNEADRLQAESDRAELAEMLASVDELKKQLDAIPDKERAASDDIATARARLDRLATGRFPSRVASRCCVGRILRFCYGFANPKCMSIHSLFLNP
jgi:outer membrane murein-binding lipoprotein Lpp